MIRITKILAIIIMIINVANSEQYIGFEQGYMEGKMTGSLICKTGEFSINTTVYNSLSLLHLYIGLLLFIFVIGKLIQKEVLSHIVCLSSLILTLYFYYDLWFRKSFFLDDTETFGRLMRNNTGIDWFCVLAVFGLLIYQITLVVFYFNENKREIK